MHKILVKDDQKFLKVTLNIWCYNRLRPLMNTILSFAPKRMDLERIMLSEINYTHTSIACILSYSKSRFYF